MLDLIQTALGRLGRRRTARQYADGFDYGTIDGAHTWDEFVEMTTGGWTPTSQKAERDARLSAVQAFISKGFRVSQERFVEATQGCRSGELEALRRALLTAKREVLLTALALHSPADVEHVLRRPPFSQGLGDYGIRKSDYTF